MTPAGLRTGDNNVDAKGAKDAKDAKENHEKCSDKWCTWMRNSAREKRSVEDYIDRLVCGGRSPSGVSRLWKSGS